MKLVVPPGMYGTCTMLGRPNSGELCLRRPRGAPVIQGRPKPHQLAALVPMFTRCAAAAGTPPEKPEPSSSPQDEALLQHLRSLPPRDLLAVHSRLSQATTLQQVASGESTAESLLQDTEQQLAELLPTLQTRGAAPGRLVHLQEQAAAALAADMKARAPSHLSRVLTLVNIAWFCGCVLVAAALFSLVGIHLAALVVLIPAVAWEVLGYATSVWLIHTAIISGEATATYVALTGLLLLNASAGGTVSLHLGPWFGSNEAAIAALMAFFAAVYGGVAVRLQASLLGTLAIWWAVSSLGFSILVFPFLTVIGFRSGVARPFAASLLLILAALPFKAAPQAFPTPAWLKPFETGLWLWCPLVLNTANLILAHKSWVAVSLPAFADILQLPALAALQVLAWAAIKYIGSQLLAVSVIGGTLACGVVLQVEQCRAIGATFGFVWFLSKLAEINWRRAGFAWAALVFGSVLWGAAYFVNTHPGFIMPARTSGALSPKWF